METCWILLLMNCSDPIINYVNKDREKLRHKESLEKLSVNSISLLLVQGVWWGWDPGKL